MAGLRGLGASLREAGVPAASDDLYEIFDEIPVTLDEFVTSKKYLNNLPLSPIQYDAVRALEQVFYAETYELLAKHDPYWKPVRFINFAYIQWGKGSGKDHICRVAVARVAYLLLCLKSPQKYFGMQPQDEIHVLNVALSATQAHTAFFKPLRTMLAKESPWFADKFAGDVPGEQATSIRLKKQVELISGHSMAETLEGLNLLLAIADEIAAFRTKEEAERFTARGAREPAKTAEAILKVLRTSATTRFPENFKLAAISYPRFKGDAIQSLCLRGWADNEKKGAKSRYLVSGPYASWEVNPRLQKADFIEVPGATCPIPNIQTFIEDYETDPVMARAMYECKPELSANQFFRNEIAVMATFAEPRPDPILIEYYWGVDETSDGYMRDESGNVVHTQAGWQIKFHFAQDFVPIQGAAYALHGDMAISGDRAGVAMAHIRNRVEGEWSHQWHEHDEERKVFESRPLVKVDFVTSFKADITAMPKAREVQIRWYRKLIYELISRGFNIQRVTFDNFQSADTIQILEAQGIESEVVSMDRTAEHWHTLRDTMYDGRLEAYFRPVVVDEILAITRLPNGKLDHPPGGSKDEADALCGAVAGALVVGGSEGEMPVRVGYEMMDNSFEVLPSTDWSDNALLSDDDIYSVESWESLGQLEI